MESPYKDNWPDCLCVFVCLCVCVCVNIWTVASTEAYIITTTSEIMVGLF